MGFRSNNGIDSLLCAGGKEDMEPPRTKFFDNLRGYEQYCLLRATCRSKNKSLEHIATGFGTFRLDSRIGRFRNRHAWLRIHDPRDAPNSTGFCRLPRQAYTFSSFAICLEWTAVHSDF